VAFGVFFGYSYMAVTPVAGLVEREAFVSGTVAEEPYTQYGRHYVVLNTDSVALPEAPQSFKLRISVEDATDIQKEDRLSVKAHFIEIPKESLSARRAKGIFIYAYQVSETDIAITKAQPSIKRTAAQFRRSLIDAIGETLPEQQAGLLRAALISDASGLDTQTQLDYRRSGVTHMLVVSGMHTMLICFALMALFGFLRLPRRLSAVLAGLAVLFFMLLVGFTPSVNRAGIMALIMLLGKLLRREADSTNSMGLACLIICLVNPMAAADIGLQLSVLATLGLILLTPIIYSKIRAVIEKSFAKEVLRKLTKALALPLAQTLGATVLTAPVILVNFHEFSLVSPLVNILIALPFSLFMMAGGIGAMLQMTGFLAVAGKPFSIVAFVAERYLHLITHGLGSASFASVNLPFSYITIWVSGTLLLFAIALLLRRNASLFKQTAVLSAIVLLIGAASYSLLDMGVTKIYVPDVGNNCAALIVKGKKGLMIGAGGGSYDYKTVAVAAQQSGMTELEALILPDLEASGAGLLSDVSQSWLPKSVAAPSSGKYKALMVNSFPQASLFKLEGAKLSPWRGAELTVFTDDTEKSWIWLEIKEFSLLLCPKGGDVKRLAPQYLSPTAVVLYSADISGISGLNCGSCIISADQKSAAKIELMLRNTGINNIYKTAEGGSLLLETRGRPFAQISSLG
jgi:competence protein ComEC